MHFEEVLRSKLGTLYNLVDEAAFMRFMQAARLVLCMKEQAFSFTGLIFSGFGEDEIFPRLYAFNVSFIVGNRLRYYEDSDRAVAIEHNNPGAVADFAQTDVIRTILTGVDPWLDEVHQNNFKKLFSKFRDDLISNFGRQSPEMKHSLEQIDLEKLTDSYQKMNAQLQHERYIEPLLAAVNTLSKEDLAEMAESLIYLTYLKRRITFAEESVGGPVDVAIISKGRADALGR